MTRVLMTADTVGGVWTYALELTAALATYDVHVHLAVLGPAPTAAQLAEARHAGVVDVVRHPGALEWMPHPWRDVDAAGEWLLEQQRACSADLVHLNDYAHAALPWPVPVVSVAHSDVVSWWRAVHGTTPPTEWSEYVDRVRAGLAAADAVVAPTRAVLDDLAVSFGHRGGVVIPNCRRDDWVTPQVKEPLVLAAGRLWDDAKNVSRLDEIASDLPWPVLIAGADDDPSRQCAGQPEHDGAVRLGRLEFGQLARWLSRAAIFVAPARYEPFGLGPLEAAIAGSALVLGDIASLREVWADAAVYVDPDDTHALLDTVRRLCQQPQQVDGLGERAREHARRYSPAVTARAYAGLYRRLRARVTA